MDLPATQAIDEDEIAPTQKLPTDENDEKSLVGALHIDNQSYSIFPGITTIGRHPACKINIKHETVSIRHAEIEAQSANGTIFIRDLNSSNKTRINRVKLIPNSSYQFKDGDELIFGKVVARFKLYQPLEDSLISCTPQVNKKNCPIIPSTPDSSLNASSDSENDLSAIPGTQADEIDTCFRRPKIPIRTSTSNEQKSPRIQPFTLDDLPSPLSKDKTKPDDICDAETQRLSSLNIKDDFNSSIYSAETQKLGAVNKSDDSDENIYDMETQRPFNPDEDKDDIQNQATQRCDYTESSTIRKSINDVSIYSAETQKNPPINESAGNLEIQKDDRRKSDHKRMSIDVSIYSAETQKVTSDECIENLETQQFEVKSTDKFKVPDSSKRKSSNKSIHDIETQKCVPNTTITESLEDIETQRFSCAETELNKRKTSNESLDDLETQRFDNSTNFNTHSIRENADNQKLVGAKTKKSISESFEDIETQRFSCVETEFSKAKTTNESLDDLETQRFDNSRNSSRRSVKNDSDNQTLVEAKTQKRISESLEDIETQRFSYVETEFSQAKTTNESLHNLATQPLDNFTNFNINSVKENATNQTLVEGKTHQKISETSNDKSLDNLKTRQYIKEYANTVINESTENVESHKLDNQNSSSLFSAENMKTLSCIEDKLSLNTSVQKLNRQNPELHSYDSGFRSSEHESDGEKTSSILSEDRNYSDSHTTKSSQSSSQQKNISMTVNASAEKSNSQKECLDSTDLKRKDGVHSSSYDKLNISNNCKNNEQADNTVDEDDEDMFCSQNLIEDCPFAFLPDESQNNDDQLDTMSKQMNKSSKNDTRDILIASTNFDNKNTNKNVKNLSKMKQAMTLTEDSETDEEGIFSNNSCQEVRREKLVEKANEVDSETDEEGIFLNNTSHKDDNKSLNENNKKNDSETDEEGIFSNHASEEIEKRNTNKQNYEIQNSDSETDEEGIFSNCAEFKNKKSNKSNDSHNSGISVKKVFSSDSNTKLDNNDSNINKSITTKISVTNPGNKNNLKSLESETKRKIVRKSPTPDSQDNIFDKNYDADEINKKETNKIRNSNEVIDELAPTQIVETATFETEDINLAVTQTADSNSFLNTYKNKTNDVDDLAPTQIINVNKLKKDDNSEDEFLAPTQIVSVHKSYIHSTEEDLDPTQIIPRGNSPVEKRIEQFVDLDLAPTQKIDTQDIIDKDEPRALYQSKRHLEEIEIGCNKKLKKDKSQAVKIDLNTTMENNLDAMFEGAEEHPEEKEETLLTQQLEHILESSQIENNSEIELNASLPSPTIGTRRRSVKGKIRRKAVILDKVNSSIEAKKLAANLNDTIERNLKEMFDDSINPEEYEPEETLMTQQLKKVLDSQDDTPSNAKEIGTLIKSQDFSPSVGKKHRLSLSINLNKKSKLSNVQSALDKSETTSQRSNSNEESQDTAEYFANLKSKKKYNVLEDSQSEDDMMNRQVSGSSDKEVIYKRGTLGFSTEGKPVSTMQRVAFLETKGRSFTSDSQSDVEELNSAVTNFKTCGKKRFSLSLSKNVDLNSSLSSMSDQEVDKKVCKEQKELNRKSTHISTIKIGSESRSVKKINKDKINICDTAMPRRRVRAPGTIGFTDSLEPIECDELVSAASTESEDAHIKILNESRSVRKTNKDKINICDPARSRRRVRAPGIIGFTDSLEPIECDELVSATSTESEDEQCRQKVYKSKNISVVSNIKVATPNTRRKMASEPDGSSDIIPDSEDEFLKTMPDIKVAGTSECPPTASQLAAPSDNEDPDDEIISIKDFEIKDKWNELARKRYDMVSRSNQSNVKKGDSSLNSTVEEITVKKTKIDQIIKEIESTGSKKRVDKKVNPATHSENEPDGKSDKTTPRRYSSRQRVHRDQLTRESSSFIESSPGLEMDVVKCNSETSFSNMNDENNSDSDNSTKLFRKYIPPEPIDIRAMLDEKFKDEENSDEEFVELRKKCEKMLNVQITYATRKPQILKQTVKSKQKTSPKNARIAKKRALNNSNSINITRSNSGIKHEKSSPKTRTVDKDASVLQVSSDSSMKRTTATSRMPGLTIIRNKRSMAPDVDDQQAQATKRTKTTASDDRPKLQELSATETTSPTIKKNKTTMVPKTVDSYVGRQKSKGTKTDSLDVPAIGICVLDNKKESSIKPTRVGSRTRGKAAASNKKMIDSAIASNNSSKENVIVEDSDIESTPPKPKTRRGKSAKNQTDTDSSAVKDSSTENEEIKIRGRSTRRNQKKSETTNQGNKSNQKTIILDSDSENVEIAGSVNRRVKSTRSKAVQSSDSGDSGKIKNIRSLKNKDSTLDDSENKLKSKDYSSGKIQNISSRSQKNKDSTLDDSENELKSKEKSLVDSLKSEELTTQSRAMRNRKGPTNKSVNLEQSQVSIIKQNKSIRDKTRDTSSDSVFSESGDDNKVSSAKQTRKRPATTTVSTIKESSEESQEVAEILSNQVKEAGNSRLRRGRTTKKSTESSSEYTHNSEGTKSNSDNVFEKPVSRPKRARLSKSVKNRSTSEHDSDEKKDEKSEHSRHLSVFTRKNTPSPTRLRRPTSVSPMKRSLHKVLFTGEKSAVHRKMVKNLGGSVVDDIADCSILVTDKVLRTCKFLCCLAQGIPIVSINWLDDSNKVSHFLDWQNYILQDRNAETKFKFKLAESLEKAKKHKLFEGYTVLLTSRIKLPPISELKGMITSSGGKPLVRAPANWPEKTVVVTIKEDLQSAKKLIAKAPKSIPVCSTEFILTGLLRQEINLQEFTL